MIETYKIRRPSLIGLQVRGIDELVPEAHLWRLTDGMVRGGRLRTVSIPEADFAAAVEKYCPEQAAAIYAKLGVDPIEVPKAAVRGRVRGTRTVIGTPAVPIDVELPV